MAPRGRPTRLNPNATPTPVADPTTTTSVTSAQLQAMIDEGVTAVLAARATTRNGDDSHTSGTGVRRNERAVRECTYQDFMKCQPLFFRGTEGVVDLTQWFERMETVFRISNCTVENQVKFATCTLMGIALTWWNSHVRTVTNDVAYAMTWTDLKKKMTTKYCPRNEIKKIEAELWNLKVKGTDVVAYNQRFQELALLCDRMFPEETDKIERYVGGMPDLIYSSVVASKPKTMQEAIEMATELMDRRINTFAERQAENKRKAKPKQQRGDGYVSPKQPLPRALQLGVAGQTQTTTLCRGPSSCHLGELILIRQEEDGSLRMCIEYRELQQNSRISTIEGFREEDVLEDCLRTRFGHYEFQKQALRATREHLKIILELLKNQELYGKIFKCESLDSKSTVPRVFGALVLMQGKSSVRSKDLEALLLLSDYDCNIRYQGKANVVADALSRKERDHTSLRVRALRQLDGKLWNLVRMEPDASMARVGRSSNSPAQRSFKRQTEKIIKLNNGMHSRCDSKSADAVLSPVPLDGLHFDDKLQFVEEPIEITDREVKRLKRSRIPLVKVRWSPRVGSEFYMEREDQFHEKLPTFVLKAGPHLPLTHQHPLIPSINVLRFNLRLEDKALLRGETITPSYFRSL
ncbi:reverse transcriptase domain-containing protein [Tanacetum coccineum]